MLGYDFAKKLGVREAVLTGNYLYQQPDVNNTFTRRFEHITSVHFRLEDGRWGVRDGRVEDRRAISASATSGRVMLMPYFNVTDKLQFVARYTFVESDGNNGVSLPTYENRVARGTGDEYSEGYLGVNYYFYGHRLKLQSGVQFGRDARPRQRRRRLFRHVLDDRAARRLVGQPPIKHRLDTD